MALVAGRARARRARDHRRRARARRCGGARVHRALREAHARRARAAARRVGAAGGDRHAATCGAPSSGRPDRIARFHEPQRVEGYRFEEGGARLELRVQPLERVGLYVPGGSARYPSSVLMTAVPARIAGVREIVMVTPGPSAETLYAAQVAGVHRVFVIGGAQAVAALAFGTETVPRVDKIVGPGNAWVAEAKRQLFGQVDIDAVAGPSEILVIADDAADPRAGRGRSVVAGRARRRGLRGAGDDVGRSWPRRRRAPSTSSWRRCRARRSPRESIAPPRRGAGDAARSTRRSTFADRYAPEHLELLVRDADAVAHAGAARGRDLRRRLHARGGGRLPGRAEPRAADGRHGALRLAARRVRLRQAHVAACAGTTAALEAHADDIVRAGRGRGACTPTGAPSPRGASERRAKHERAWKDLVRQPLRGAPAYRCRRIPTPSSSTPTSRPIRCRARRWRRWRASWRRSSSTAIPTPARCELRRALAARLGVAVEELMLGNGSDELIALLCATFAEPRAGPGARQDRVRRARVRRVPHGGAGARARADRGAVRAALRAGRSGALRRRRRAQAEPHVPGDAQQSDRHAVAALDGARSCSARTPTSSPSSTRPTSPTATPRAASTWRWRTTTASSCRRCRRSGWRRCASGLLIGRRELLAAVEKVRPPYNLSTLAQRAALKLVTRPQGGARVALRGGQAAAARAARRRSARCRGSRSSRRAATSSSCAPRKRARCTTRSSSAASWCACSTRGCSPAACASPSARPTRTRGCSTPSRRRWRRRELRREIGEHQRGRHNTSSRTSDRS